MSAYERWQADKYGNVIPEQQDREEYEYLNMENREFTEWLEKEETNNQQQ